MDVAVSRTVNIQRRFEARKTRFLAHGAFAKVFGRASTTQATTTHRLALKTVDNDSPLQTGSIIEDEQAIPQHV